MYRPFIGKGYVNRKKIDGRNIISLRTGPNTTDAFITPNPDIENGSLLDILSSNSLEFSEVRYKSSSGSLITGFVKTIYLRLVCDCCLEPLPIEIKDYLLWAEAHKKLFHPKIIIGRYEFQLLYKENGPNYKKIKIRNITQQQTTFKVYPSNSQGNIYRFCLQDVGSHLYKGNDYVAETFIHMDLQKFINENKHKLKEFEDQECENVTSIIPYLSETYRNYLIKRYVEFDDEFIKIISRLSCGNGFSHTYKIIGNMIDIYDASSRILSPIQHARLLVDMEIILKSIHKGTDKSQLEIEFKQLYVDLFKKNRHGQDSGLSNMVKYNIMSYYLIFISKYLYDNYSIEFKTIRELFNSGDFFMEKYKHIKLNFTFYSVIIQNKTNKLTYTIIYAKYNYENSLEPKLNNNYTIMLNLIPHGLDEIKGNEINSLGLYKKYTIMGIYLCKPFDYVLQVKSMALGEETHNYHFLGHVYDNLFPVKQINEFEQKKDKKFLF